MELTWQDIIIDFTNIENKDLTENWTWLIGEKMAPIMISCIGDMFLEDEDGKIHWLNVGDGSLELVAENKEELQEKMDDEKIANEWFMFSLVYEIKQSGLNLTAGKLYGYKLPPVLGGEYKADNFTLISVTEHFSFSGDLHEKIKDLPDGTPINIDLK